MNENLFKNHNYRTRHSADLARSSFSPLSNFLEMQFFSISLGVLLEKKFLDNRDCLTHNSTDSLWCLFSSLTNSLLAPLVRQRHVIICMCALTDALTHRRSCLDEIALGRPRLSDGPSRSHDVE